MEFIAEIVVEILSWFIESERVPRTVRIAVLTAVFLFLFAVFLLCFIDCVRESATLGGIIVGIILLAWLAGYAYLLRKIIKNS